MNYKLVTEAELPQVMELWDYCFEKRKILSFNGISVSIV